MQIISYLSKSPEIDEDHFLAPGSFVIGNVKIRKGVNIWFNAVVRGDVNQIEIGANTNIQDLSILHVTSEYSLTIGKNVTVGHSAILHACEVGDGSLIGMGAKILDGAIIGKQCLVAAGSVVPPGKTYPDGSMIMGAPAKAVRELSAEERKLISEHYQSYLILSKDYQN